MPSSLPAPTPAQVEAEKLRDLARIATWIREGKG